MKRSDINNYIRQVIDILDRHQFRLPLWAKATPQEWEQMAATGDYNEIIDNQLGWDITDFGKNNFIHEGLSLFTVRNGSMTQPEGKTYCEKIMVAWPQQQTPAHFHWNKMEDIICRAGGNLAIQLWRANQEEQITDEPFTVQVDGVTQHLEAGDIVRLTPGQSITLEPYIYHCFWAEGEPCMIGEVSKVNDDAHDNRFLAPLGRFPEIIEDEAPQFLLCTEYPKGK